MMEKAVLKNIELYNCDCIEFMKNINRKFSHIITDIPYNCVNRHNNGLRNLDKGSADILTFELDTFLTLCDNICENNIIIFCGIEQISKISSFYKNKGTVRVLVWEKTNPSPMNGQYVYLSGVEFAIWVKNKNSKVFNAHCKNTVFRHPCGSSKSHPTQKPEGLMEELILDNTAEGDTIFDPCCGSGSTGVACLKLNRKFVGCEIDNEYFKLAKRRLGLDKRVSFS